tara:strand:+ start:629 stop:1897 length:1269 start_codon:yes stop_codon:yes gene_type:complete
MSEYVIKIEDISKCYRIGLYEKKNDTIMEAFISFLKSPFTNYRNLKKVTNFNDRDNTKDIIWALKNISLSIKKGEVLGIIGSNGAGKSTLLKILAKITTPTNGKITINGHVSSLLEVGTGFHPDLTGRENIYLNGTILGMKKKEIDNKIDKIIQFSGVKKLIDTPVKRFSSGMTMRLAFSIAAHLDSEILLIDEVLAVGDIEFQKKCLNKVESITTAGRTVIFVSHNFSAINSICSRCIMIENGSIISDNTPQIVTQLYTERYMTNENNSFISFKNKKDKKVQVLSSEIIDNKNNRIDHIKVSKEFGIKINFKIKNNNSNIVPQVIVLNSLSEIVFISTSHNFKYQEKKEDYNSIIWFPSNFFNSGRIYFRIILLSTNPIVFFDDKSGLNINIDDEYNSITKAGYHGDYPGLIRPFFKWTNN